MSSLLNFFLLFSKETVIVITFLLGYFFYSKKIFFHAIVLTLTSMVVAAFLKSIFKVPLMPHLGEGWSLPSGHMFVTAAFWGFLTIELRNKLFSILSLIILSGVAISLVYLNYHSFIDIVAAVVFAFILIALYRLLLNIPTLYYNDDVLSLILFGVSCLLVFLMPNSLSHLKLALGGLLGLGIGSLLAKTKSFSKSGNNIIEFVLCIAGVFLIYYLSLHLKSSSDVSLFIKGAILSVWIVVGANFILASLKSSGRRK